jgi:hypothetical protein
LAGIVKFVLKLFDCCALTLDVDTPLYVTYKFAMSVTIVPPLELRPLKPTLREEIVIGPAEFVPKTYEPSNWLVVLELYVGAVNDALRDIVNEAGIEVAGTESGALRVKFKVLLGYQFKPSEFSIRI